MTWKLMGDVVAAALALFGLYCLLRLFSEHLFGSKQVGRYVRVTSYADIEQLDYLLDMAKHPLSPSKGEVIVLLPGEAAEDAALLECLAARGVDCLFID